MRKNDIMCRTRTQAKRHELRTMLDKMEGNQESNYNCVRTFISNFIIEIIRILNESSLRQDEVNHVLYRIDRLELMLNLCTDSIDVNPLVFQAVSQTKDALSNLAFEEISATAAIQARKIFSGDRGRPRYVLAKEQL